MMHRMGLPVVPCGGAGGVAYRPLSIVAAQGAGFLIVRPCGDARGGASCGSSWWYRGRGLPTSFYCGGTGSVVPDSSPL